jgi:hypothetical protein
MAEIIYNPQEAGKEFTNKKGKIIKIRKYYLTPEEMKIDRERWEEEVVGVDIRIKRKAASHFFNPYRRGIYYYQVQSLFLLGCNEWHSLPDFLKKLEEYTSSLPLNCSIKNHPNYSSPWNKFRGKSSRDNAQKCKDWIGRVQENFVLLQRLSRLHPYGYKLYQVYAAIDIKRINKPGFSTGAYFYRLSTYNEQKDALPIRDFTNFTFPQHERRYVNYKFIGTIMTKDKTVIEGVIK